MLKVLKAGFLTSIQDKGRIGFASNGVPISGSMDSYSSDLANSILDNSLKDAVIEITLGGCSFQFLEKTVFCVSGGDFSPAINGKNIPLNKSIEVCKNDILSFGKVHFGARCYVAVKGGFLSEMRLESRSFYKNITKSITIKKEDIIPFFVVKKKLSNTYTSIKINQNHFNDPKIKCYKGPEFYLLNEAQQQRLLSQVFSISKDNSRMGYKLNEVLENNFPQILTSAVLPGTLQLTPSGKLIVLMRDCQVTGGYPRVLQMAESSINKLAQKPTNNKFQFVLIS